MQMMWPTLQPEQPRSLRYDDLHPSQVLQENALHIGADVNAEFIYQYLTKKAGYNDYSNRSI